MCGKEALLREEKGVGREKGEKGERRERERERNRQKDRDLSACSEKCQGVQE